MIALQSTTKPTGFKMAVEELDQFGRPINDDFLGPSRGFRGPDLSGIPGATPFGDQRSRDVQKPTFDQQMITVTLSIRKDEEMLWTRSLLGL